MKFDIHAERAMEADLAGILASYRFISALDLTKAQRKEIERITSEVHSLLFAAESLEPCFSQRQRQQKVAEARRKIDDALRRIPSAE
jgi:hypothetical protein